MANIPDQTPSWAPIPLIEKTDRVEGGIDGAANRQAVAISHRLTWAQQALEALSGAASQARAVAEGAVAQAGAAATDAQTAYQRAATAQALADAANAQAATADGKAVAAQSAATTAQTMATSADGKATAAQTTATAADGKAVAADGKATTAQSIAATADTNATAAVAAAAAKATRIDLGSITLTYTAIVILGAGARSIEVNCTGARVNDAVFVAATGAIPDGYAVGAAQCLVADKIRVSVVHPALALNASFSIPLRVFVLR